MQSRSVTAAASAAIELEAVHRTIQDPLFGHQQGTSASPRIGHAGTRVNLQAPHRPACGPMPLSNAGLSCVPESEEGRTGVAHPPRHSHREAHDRNPMLTGQVFPVSTPGRGSVDAPSLPK